MMPTSKILLRKIKPVLMKREIEFLRQLSVADGELFQFMLEGFVQVGYFTTGNVPIAVLLIVNGCFGILYNEPPARTNETNVGRAH